MHSFNVATVSVFTPSILIDLRERIRDLLASVHGANKHKQRAASDSQSKASLPLVALVVAHDLLRLVEHQVHEGVVAFECSDDCSRYYVSQSIPAIDRVG